MCLAIPGSVVSIDEDELRTGDVSFGGAVKRVCLAYTPEAAVGDFVIVHAGFAIARLDPEAALRVLRDLEAIGERP
jgi:hydrogenase expression/formation protein HypC